MIFLKVKIDNFYMFKDTKFDFTYKAKLPRSTIDYEWLEQFPNIKYKKVNIITGANASGKTNLGKMLMLINHFIASGNTGEDFIDKVREKDKHASFKVLFVTHESEHIHELEIVFDHNGTYEEKYKKVKIFKTLSLPKLIERLETTKFEIYFNRDSDNDGIPQPGFSSQSFAKGVLPKGFNWNYCFAEKNSKHSPGLENFFEVETITKILQAFDSSIKNVKRNEQGVLTVLFTNGDHCSIDSGEPLPKHRMSRGTLESVEVAMFYCWVNQLQDGVFFLDEKLAYSHTEIEQCILNLMIDKLGRHAQLFYTTHNYDILDMSLPTHSYTFLKRGSFTEAVHPEKLGYTKNDRTLLTMVKNDVFGTIPNTSLIDSLL